MFTLAASGLTVAQDSGTDAGGSLIGFLLPLVILGGLFYFVLVMPQRRRVRQMQELRDSIAVGDEIRTVGGIYGTVERIDDESMTIDVGGGLTLRIAKRAVADKLSGTAATEDTE